MGLLAKSHSIILLEARKTYILSYKYCQGSVFLDWGILKAALIVARYKYSVPSWTFGNSMPRLVYTYLLAIRTLILFIYIMVSFGMLHAPATKSRCIRMSLQQNGL